MTTLQTKKKDSTSSPGNMASSKSILRAQEPVTYTCSLCDSEDNVNWYCNDCQEALCDRCKEYHSRGKKTKNDDIVPIGRAKRQDDQPVPEVCKLHPGKLQDLFCSDCKTLICNMCLSKTHKHHNWKHLEETVETVKTHLNEQMMTISKKVELFKTNMSKLESANKASVKNIDEYRKEVNSQRTKLIAEVNSVADLVLVELSALEKEESATYKTACQQYQTKVRELTRLHDQTKVAITSTSVGSMLDTDWLLCTTMPHYTAEVKTVVPKPSRFVVGNINRDLLRKMLGELQYRNQYEKKDINSEYVKKISKFTVTQKSEISSICPMDHSHAWLSIYGYNNLILVSKEGVVTDTVVLDFKPLDLAMVETTDILMTRIPVSTLVYKLSLHNKQVTIFANIGPHKAMDISIHQTGEVYVSTGTLDLVVLNQSGTIVRGLTCTEKGFTIACMSADIAVSTGKKYIASNVSFIDTSGTTLQKWSGVLNNDAAYNDRHLLKMSCDRYDRLFVPDYINNQVYVLPRTSTRATCLLDRKHGVVKPTAVGVDTCGDVWIGCGDGTVHVMKL